MNRDVIRAFAVIESWYANFPNADKAKGFDVKQFKQIFQLIIKQSPSTERAALDTLKAWEVIGNYNYSLGCYVINDLKYSIFKKSFPNEFYKAKLEFVEAKK